MSESEESGLSEGSEEEESASSLSDSEAPPAQAFAQLSLEELQSIEISTCTHFQALLTILATEDSDKAKAAALRIRKLLSVEDAPPIQQVIDAGGIDVLHKAMKHELPEVRIEATWALTNMLSGSTQQVTLILKSNCIPTLIGMFTPQESWAAKEQALWALGNIAGDCAEYRNKLLHAGALTAVLNNLNMDSAKYMQNTCWVVSNLTRGKPPPNPRYLIEAGPFVVSMISSAYSNAEMLTDLMWSFSYITEVTIDDMGLTEEKMMDIMRCWAYPTISVAIPAMRVIGNIISSTDRHTQFLLTNGLCELIKSSVFHQKRPVRREAAWVTSNICAEGASSIQILLNAEVFPALVQVSLEDEEAVRTESIWALANACGGSSVEQKLRLIEMRVGSVLEGGLHLEQEKIVAVSLEGLKELISGLQEAGQTDALKRHLKLTEIVAKSKNLAREGNEKAKNLLKALRWLNLNDNEMG